MTDPFLLALAWSGGGFVVGFVTCWAAVHIKYSNSDKVQSVNKTQSANFEVFRAVLGVVLLLLVAVSGYRYYIATTCQADYNVLVAEALIQRSDAQRAEGFAQIQLLNASLAGDPEAFVRETQEYIEAISELERVRASSPLPSPPNCGRL